MSAQNEIKFGSVIDLFCGAGGLSSGFEQAGFSVFAGNDMMASAGSTFASTHQNAKFLHGEIQKFSAQDFLEAAGLEEGQLHCLIGGPPCQAFSVYNHQRGLEDDRAHLFREYMRIVAGLKPAWVVLENVTGILSAGNGKAVDAIKVEFAKLGYQIEMRVLKAEEFGIPQERRRVIFLGNRTGQPIVWPKPTHGAVENGLLPYVTIRDAIGDLPPLRNGESANNSLYLTSPTSEFQRLLRGNKMQVSCHAAPKLGDINIERMSHIPPGGSWRDIPFELLPNGMKRANRSDHTKRYGRMTWGGLACTVLTKCDIHWGAYIHPEQDRAITVREAARLQSFPDSFDFSGTRTEQYVQVGNAVPPLLGKVIAESILAAGQSKKTEVSCAATEVAA